MVILFSLAQFIGKIGKNENLFSAVVGDIEFVFIVLVEEAHRLTQQLKSSKVKAVRSKEVYDRRHLVGHQDVAGLVKADSSRLFWRDGTRFFVATWVWRSKVKGVVSSIATRLLL